MLYLHLINKWDGRYIRCGPSKLFRFDRNANIIDDKEEVVAAHHFGNEAWGPAKEINGNIEFAEYPSSHDGTGYYNVVISEDPNPPKDAPDDG